MHLAYPASLQALHSNNSETDNANYMTGLKSPTAGRQAVGYLQVWLKIWTQDDREQIQHVARAGLELGMVWLLVWHADHSAMLPSTAASHKMSLTYNYLDGLIVRNREAAGGWTV